MAKTEKFPMKTPDVKEKKISEKERDKGGYGMAKKDGVKVLLDGQGADETLAGYKKYSHWYLQEKIQAEGWKTTSEEASILRLIVPVFVNSPIKP